MARYRVDLTRVENAYLEGSVEVEAESVDEAAREALKLLEADDEAANWQETNSYNGINEVELVTLLEE